MTIVYILLLTFLEQLALIRNAEHEILRTHNKLLRNLLQNCSYNIALILPETLCLEHVKRLVRSGHFHSFVGKDVYLRTSYGYHFEGVVSGFQRRRFQGSQAAGLWDWWTQLITHPSKLIKEDEVTLRPKKPSMEGNVMLIFAILVLGCSISIMVWVVETRRWWILFFARICAGVGRFCLAISENNIKNISQ